MSARAGPQLPALLQPAGGPRRAAQGRWRRLGGQNTLHAAGGSEFYPAYTPPGLASLGTGFGVPLLHQKSPATGR